MIFDKALIHHIVVLTEIVVYIKFQITLVNELLKYFKNQKTTYKVGICKTSKYL